MKIELRASRMLTALLLLAHGAAVVLLVLAGLPPWLVAAAGAVLVLNGCRAVWQRALLRAPLSVCGIEIGSGAEPSLRVHARGGGNFPCAVLPTTYVGSFLTVLNLRHEETGVRMHVVILPDGIDNEDFRKLRVWLRWHRSAELN